MSVCAHLLNKDVSQAIIDTFSVPSLKDGRMGRSRGFSSVSDEVFNFSRSPSGFVPGTLMFPFYINDFSNCTKLFDFHIFADDTNSFIPIAV